MKIETILNRLKELNFNLETQHDDSHWYFKNGDTRLSLVSPHEGTEFRWMLRADFIQTLDRWSVCLFEEFFSDKNEYEEVEELLKEFICNKDIIIKEYYDE